MNTSTSKISPLRQRMIEDMRIRKLEPKTQSGYIRAVRDFIVWFGRSPDRAGPEELRLFQLHLVDKGVSPISINAMQSGLRFFFDITLNRPEVTAHMRHVRVAQRLPVVLSREEATRLIEATRNIKYRAALSVAYGAGLRASEVIGLKVSDLDSKRHVLRIEQGKGRKDRYAILPPILLTRLRGWWRHARAEGKVLPDGWLFPGLDPMQPMSTRQLNRAVHDAATAAHIDKRVSMHSLRHAFATHLLEQKGSTAAAPRSAAMRCVAHRARSPRSPTTPAAIGIVPSVRAVPRNAGWKPDPPTSYGSSTTTWSSPCRHP